MRKLLVSIIVVLALLVPGIALGADCTMATGTQALLITPQGMQAVTANRPVPVDIAGDQPTVQMLADLSLNVPGDWTDAVVVKDTNGYAVIVHRGDLTCPKK